MSVFVCASLNVGDGVYSLCTLGVCVYQFLSVCVFALYVFMCECACVLAYNTCACVLGPSVCLCAMYVCVFYVCVFVCLSAMRVCVGYARLCACGRINHEPNANTRHSQHLLQRMKKNKTPHVPPPCCHSCGQATGASRDRSGTNQIAGLPLAGQTWSGCERSSVGCQIK